MGRDEDRLVALDTGRRDELERVEFELVRSGGRVETLVLRDGDVGEARWNGDLEDEYEASSQRVYLT
jgi:hypothetical protein